MKKRILSVLLTSTLALSITGCSIVEKKPKSTTADKPPVITTATTVTTTAAATTTAKPATTTTAKPVETTTEIVYDGEYFYNLVCGNKPATTTTAKPVETVKPDDTSNAGSKLGSFTGEPEIDWGGKQLSLKIERVSGATEYHLSIDSKGFTDNGDLYNKTRSLPAKEKTTMVKETNSTLLIIALQ